MRKVVILLSSLFLVSLFSISVFGQSPATSAEGENVPAQGDIGPTYGTASWTSYVASMYDCLNTTGGNNEWTPANSPNSYITVAGYYFRCPLHLPNGASIGAIEIEACDNSASGEAQLAILHTTQPGGAATIIAQVASGVTATPACGHFQYTLPSSVTVDNLNEKYFLRMTNTVYDGTVYIAAARVFYRLQVSPAPATATFNDVPTTHPFFQYIEALVESGITAGCGGGGYCPDAPVTRGQMAVFLSRALGLHWPY